MAPPQHLPLTQTQIIAPKTIFAVLLHFLRYFNVSHREMF